MSYKVIISLLDEHNEENILATAKYMPEKVLFIYEKEEYKIGKIEILKQYYATRFPVIQFLSICIDQLNINEIHSMLSNVDKESTLITLNGGDKLTSLFFLYISKKYKIDCVYIDIEKENLITFKDGEIFTTEENFLDLGVRDIIESRGGSILVEGTDISHCKSVEKLTELISEHQRDWQRLKYRICDNRVFIHDSSNPSMININLNYLTNEELRIYMYILGLLKEYKQLDYKFMEGYIRIRFLNDYIKSFIFKSGSWFEIFTKNIIEEIDIIDDVKNGVLFLWNDYKRRIKNELDVVAIKDSILICISCKDSAKYDEVALNELNVYADKLGGDKVVKILATTKKPLKGSVVDRASEMGINLVIYDGDKEKFKDTIKDIIYSI